MPVFQPNIQKLVATNNVQGLIKATRNLDPEIRRQSVAALGAYKGSNVYTALLKTLRDEERSVRIESIFSLGKLRERSSVKSLEWMLNDRDPVIRMNILWALGQIGGKDIIRPMIHAMGDADKNVRMRSVDTLSRMVKLAIPDLTHAMKGNNPLIRRNVINVLGRSKNRDLVPEIIRSLDDPVTSVRENAIWALGEIGDPRAVPLLERLKNPKAKYSLKQVKEGPHWKTVAQNYEKAGRYEDAASLLEMKGEWDEAGRLRNKEREPNGNGLNQILANSLKLSQETIIRDSVINRSSIGRGETKDSVINRSSTGRGEVRESVINRGSIRKGKVTNSVTNRSKITESTIGDSLVHRVDEKGLGLREGIRTRERDAVPTEGGSDSLLSIRMTGGRQGGGNDESNDSIRSSSPMDQREDTNQMCPHCKKEWKFDFRPSFCPYCAGSIE